MQFIGAVGGQPGVVEPAPVRGFCGNLINISLKIWKQGRTYMHWSPFDPDP